MPGFGLDGPYSEYPAFGSTAEAMAGINSMIGYDAQRPLQTGLSYADPVSGLNLVNTILAFARRRGLTGKGNFVDLALADSPLGTLGEYFVANSSKGYLQEPQGNVHPYYSPHGAFRCKGKDQWIAISITNNAEWSRFKHQVNDPRLSPTCYSNVSSRQSNANTINQIIEEWASDKDATELMELLQGERIPSGKVSNNLEVLNDVHLNARDYFSYLTPKDGEEEKYDGQAIPGNQKEREEWFPMKNLGEDSSDVLLNYLGYSKSKYLSLIENEIIS